MNPSKCPKPGLISQICNSLNFIFGLNQETQFTIKWWNWKKNQFKKSSKVKKKSSDKKWSMKSLKKIKFKDDLK
jgi:hypothetical protein